MLKQGESFANARMVNDEAPANDVNGQEQANQRSGAKKETTKWRWHMSIVEVAVPVATPG